MTATSSFTLTGEEEVRLHLKSTMGLGLLDADIMKAAKILLVAPMNADMLAKMLGITTCICGTIMGESGGVCPIAEGCGTVGRPYWRE